MTHFNFYPVTIKGTYSFLFRYYLLMKYTNFFPIIIINVTYSFLFYFINDKY